MAQQWRLVDPKKGPGGRHVTSAWVSSRSSQDVEGLGAQHPKVHRIQGAHAGNHGEYSAIFTMVTIGSPIYNIFPTL